MTEHLAIELRWLEHRDAAHMAGHRSVLTRDEVWERCSGMFKNMYRAQARHLLAVIEAHRRSPRTRFDPDPDEGDQP
jgi:hypothetical protein